MGAQLQQITDVITPLLETFSVGILGNPFAFEALQNFHNQRRHPDAAGHAAQCHRRRPAPAAANSGKVAAFIVPISEQVSPKVLTLSRIWLG